MASIETTMYTLGQLARAIWPTGDVPTSIMDTILTQPASGLALMMRHRAAQVADQEAVTALVAKLPSDLADPDGGVRAEDQGPFWTGYYHYLNALDRAKKWGPDQLERVGNLLYGTRWQSDLARALEVNDRRVRQWMAGERPIPAGVWADVAVLLRTRQQEGLALLRELDRISELPAR
jgi:hypothetical protein